MIATRRERSPAAGLLVGALIGAVGVVTLALALADRAYPGTNPLAGLSPDTSSAVRAIVGAVGLATLSAALGVVVWRQPRNLFTWLLTVTVATLATGGLAAEYAVHGLVIDPGSLPLADVAALSPKLLPDVVTVGAIAAILVFPNGRLKSTRWAIVIAAAIVAASADVMSGLDDPYPISVGILGRQPVPVTVPPAFWPVGAEFAWASSAFIWLAVIGLVAGAGVILRMRRSTGDARRQLQWFAYAASIYLFASLVSNAEGLGALDWLPAFLYAPLRAFAQSDLAAGVATWGGLAALFAGTVLVPIAIGIAVVRYRLYEIDLVVNRTILYAGLAVFVTGMYAIVVAGAGSLMGQRAGSNPLLTVVAIALVAALLLPVRGWMQSLADVAVYGRRARPYDVLSDFVREVGRAEPAAQLLPRMATLLRDGTRSTSSEVWVKVDGLLHLAASSPVHGASPAAMRTTDDIAATLGDSANLMPVRRDGELLGALVAVKPRGEQMNSVERRLLEDLASQAGVVFERFRMVEELRESRARIVVAQEAERRRIERNLHDGAQQHFANALLSLGMAQLTDSQRDPALLQQASREVQAGLGELRDLARGLNPPLLAESGLAAAVRSLADRSPLVTTVTVRTDRRYPDAIESAAYYVVAESMTNAVKHSGAATVEITIVESDGRLEVEVVDDGAGGADATRGSGILGLRDRAAAAGGTLTVESPPGKGTRVRAELPCV